MKQLYEAPEVQVIEMEVQGSLLQGLSGNDDYENGGNPFPNV